MIYAFDTLMCIFAWMLMGLGYYSIRVENPNRVTKEMLPFVFMNKINGIIFFFSGIAVMIAVYCHVQ